MDVNVTNNFIKALSKDAILANPQIWKKLQNLINLLSALTPVLALFFPQLAAILTPDFILKVSAAVSALNVYFTTATTAKIGF